MNDLGSVTGFEWDDGNREKNWISHHVTTSECEEVFFNLPLLLQHDLAHSTGEQRFFVLGQTNAGRHLFISFTVRDDKLRVISARDMSRKERRVYGKTDS
jgi:uncharacterized DUF497 family protein